MFVNDAADRLALTAVSTVPVELLIIPVIESEKKIPTINKNRPKITIPTKIYNPVLVPLSI